MLWLKAFHVIAMVTWFAGLFYLPRLFVYHADAQDPIGVERFRIMERRLFVIMTIGAAPPWYSASPCCGRAGLSEMGWLHVKLLLVALLIVYHLSATSSCAISRMIATPAAPSGIAGSTRCPRCC